MLHILLLILKILLWILLGIIGLVLFIVLLVLFAPIHYRANVVYDGKALVKAKVRFLFVSIGVEFSQAEKKLTKAIRIAGIRLGGKKKSGDKKSDTSGDEAYGELKDDLNDELEDESDVELFGRISKTPDNELNHDSSEAKTGETKVDEAKVDETVKNTGADSQNQTNQNQEETDDSKEQPDNEKTIKENPDEQGVDKKNQDEKNLDNKQSLGDRIKDIAAKLKAIWEKLSPEYIMDSIDKKSDEISDKYNKLEKKVKRYKKLWDLKCTVKTRNYLKKYLLSLVKHIGPRKIKGYVRYGFGDPAKTGQITGYISLLPFVYQKNFSLQPDFYEKVIEADVSIRGHLMLGYILRIALKPYLWRTIMTARKVVAQNKKM